MRQLLVRPRRSWLGAIFLASAASWPSSAVAAGVTKAQYIAKADAVCQAANSNVKPLEAQYEKAIAEQTTAGFTKGAQILDQVVSIDSKGLMKIRALPAPASEKSALNQIWRVSATNIATTKKVAIALRQKDSAAIKTDVSSLSQSTTRYKRLTRAFGFKDCGQG